MEVKVRYLQPIGTSQLLHLVIQCLNHGPPPKGKDTLSPALWRGTRHYLQLKAAYSSQRELWVKASGVPKTAGAGDCALWQADTIDEQAQGVFSSISRPLCSNCCSSSQLERRSIGTPKSRNCQHKLTVQADRRKSLQKRTLICSSKLPEVPPRKMIPAEEAYGRSSLKKQPGNCCDNCYISAS